MVSALRVCICALVGVLIKCLYEMHVATIKINTDYLISEIKLPQHTQSRQ